MNTSYTKGKFSHLKPILLIRNSNKSNKLCDFPATGDDNGIEQLYI